MRRPRKHYAPKGSYPHPGGGFVVDSTASVPLRNGGRLKLQMVYKAEPDMDLLVKALVDTAKQIAAESSEVSSDQRSDSEAKPHKKAA